VDPVVSDPYEYSGLRYDPAIRGYVDKD